MSDGRDERSKARGRLRPTQDSRRPQQSPYDRPPRGRGPGGPSQPPEGRGGNGGRGGYPPNGRARPEGQQHSAYSQPPHSSSSYSQPRSSYSQPPRSSYSQPPQSSYSQPPRASGSQPPYGQRPAAFQPGQSFRRSDSRPPRPDRPPDSSQPGPSHAQSLEHVQLPRYEGPPTTRSLPQAFGSAAGVPRGDRESGGPPGAGRGARRNRLEEWKPDPEVRPSKGPSKTGVKGRELQLVSNYFELKPLPNKAHYHYHVEFDPVIDNPGLRRALLYEHKVLLGHKLLFDGASLWSPVKLHENPTVLLSTRRTDQVEVKLTVKFIKPISPQDPVMMQLLNFQMRTNMKTLGFKQIRRYFYDLQQASKLPHHRLELIPGFITAIREFDAGVLMVVDPIHKTVREDTVLYVIKSEFGKNPGSFRQNAEKQILGQIVMTRYNNKSYRIDEIDWNLNPTQTFDKKGVAISYMDYYQQQYSLKITDPGQPLLYVKPSARDLRRGNAKPLYLIPELCVMTELTDAHRQDFNTMRALGEFYRPRPTDRVKKLETFVRRINSDNRVKEEMAERGYALANNLLAVKGRLQEPEGIVLTNNPNDKGEPTKADTADFAQLLQRKRLLEPMPFSNWLLVHTRTDGQVANQLLQKIHQVSQPTGIRVQNPAINICNDDRTQTISSVLSNEVSSQTQIVVVIVPNNNKERYDSIKKLCCCEFAVPSQVVVARTLRKDNGKLMSIATKIVYQMNCKLGGGLWTVVNPFKKSKIMIVGVDSYSDSAHKGKSVCATVCSMNDTLSKYFSQVAFQDSKQHEMSSAYVDQLTRAFQEFKKINKELPKVVIFYRDGVGDGQLPVVRDVELNQVKDAIRAQGSTYDPKMLYIVVNKRINTRFFMKKGQQYDNPLPGTVIDSAVTRRERYDFFLVSQSVRQGTVAPTQYNVICDSSGLQPDQLQKFTYKMTHLYYNWQGTIRVPAPVQYAHKFAFLVGQSLHSLPDERLAHTLYYL